MVDLTNHTEAEALQKLLHHVNINDVECKLAFCQDAAKCISKIAESKEAEDVKPMATF